MWVSIYEGLPIIGQHVYAKCKNHKNEIKKYIIQRLESKELHSGWQWSGVDIKSYFTLQVVKWKYIEEKIMKKLSKGFSAGNIITVNIEGETYEIANLLKSMIINHSIVLFGKDDKWKEVYISKYGIHADTSIIKEAILAKKIPYSDLGIHVSEKQNIDEFGHVDYEKLESMFPDYPYFMISKLHTHLSRFGRKSGFEDLKGFLRTISKEPKETIPEFIARSEAETSKIINLKNSKMESKIRENQLTALGLQYVPGEDCFSGHGFTITGNSVENDSEEDWQNTIERIEGVVADSTPAAPVAPEAVAPPVLAPQQGGSTESRVAELIAAGLKFDGDRTFNLTTKSAFFAVDILDIQTYSDRKWTGLMIDIEKISSGQPTEEKEPAQPVAESLPAPVVPVAPAEASATEPVKKNPVSLATIGALSEDRIVELQGLKDKQLEVVKANPFVEITNAATLKKAKAAKAALLKASTSTEKIETDASKFLNTFKAMIKNVIGSASKITREAHDKQAQAISEYENAEALRIAEEQRVKLEKIKSRTDSLFAIPMVFTGTAYNIGTLYIMPSQIESASDEEFSLLVTQAAGIKAGLDAAAEEQRKKDEELEAAKKRIAELTGQPYTPSGAPAAPVVAAPAPAAPPMPNHTPAQTYNATTPAHTPIQSPAAPIAPPVVDNAVQQPKSAVPVKYPYQLTYYPPAPENHILNKLDLENVEALENKNYQKARAYFIRGTKDTAQAVYDIIVAPSQEGVKKSDQITALCRVLLEQQ